MRWACHGNQYSSTGERRGLRCIGEWCLMRLHPLSWVVQVQMISDHQKITETVRYHMTMEATAKSLTGMAATGTKTMSNVMTRAELEEEYRAEKQRNVQLRAALIRLEHLERLEYGEEPPKDILPLPKPGDRPYSQVSASRFVPRGWGWRLCSSFQRVPPHIRRRRSTATSRAVTVSSQACRKGRQLAASLRRKGLHFEPEPRQTCSYGA